MIFQITFYEIEDNLPVLGDDPIRANDAILFDNARNTICQWGNSCVSEKQKIETLGLRL